MKFSYEFYKYENFSIGVAVGERVVCLVSDRAVRVVDLKQQVSDCTE